MTTVPGRAPRFSVLPTTELGRRAIWLGLAAIALQLAWTIMPGGALAAFALGIAGGITALVAIFRRRERAITVFAAVLPLIFVVVFVLAELLIGHD